LRANDRAENSHQPVRRRKRKMRGFNSTASAQRFVSVHATLFNVQRYLICRAAFLTANLHPVSTASLEKSEDEG
ncbi:MAG TPA: hypothetical protein VET85_16045, partial [Stellaceae bacterium]|nr:hypothetical protein [Stellaceae bacterium]